MSISDNKAHPENNKIMNFVQNNRQEGSKLTNNRVRIICYHTEQAKLEEHEL